VRRSLILDVGVQVLFHGILLLSLYLLFAGHNKPGGGFIGGLVCAAAFGLRYAAGGIDELRSVHRLGATTLLGAGLLVAASTAVASLLVGGQLLTSGKLEGDLPLLGHVKATSALPFDLGVYLVVVGLVLMVLEALGESVGDDPGPSEATVVVSRTDHDGGDP
jgi:multicomponent Na+:H+ antiporter subunit B